jgi:phenylpropionate dioxygenase-like ring-hydroxylating dioxygenase large terminal subunit
MSGEAAQNRFVRNTWYVAMFSADLAAGQLLHRTILNEPIVFFRKEDGSVAAITDRCSHRFAPLLLPGDRVQCIYHGVEFGANGKCVRNPHGNGVISSAAHLKSYPVVERHSLIWIWMGEKAADAAKIPDYSCLDDRPALHVTRPGYLKVAANYELVVDNLLDLSHISYVHVGILGNADTANADVAVDQKGDVVSVSRISKNAETPGILKMMSPAGFERGDQWNTISWYAPSNMILEFGSSKPGEPKEKGTGYFAIPGRQHGHASGALVIVGWVSPSGLDDRLYVSLLMQVTLARRLGSFAVAQQEQFRVRRHRLRTDLRVGNAEYPPDHTGQR